MFQHYALSSDALTCALLIMGLARSGFYVQGLESPSARNPAGHFTKRISA